MISDAQRQFWSQNGYLIVEKMLSAKRLENLRKALDERHVLEADHAGWEGSDNPGVRRLCNLLSKGRLMEELAVEPLALEMARMTIGSDVRWQAMNFHDPLPGDTRAYQTVHADRSFFPNCTGYMNVIWAVDELTERNGGPRLVPGSHKRPWPLNLTDSAAPIADEIFVTCPAGSAVFVHGDTWHGGRVNNTTSPRRAIHFGFSCVRTAPQYEIAGTLTPEIRRRLGDNCALIPAALESFGLAEGPTEGKSVRDLLREAGATS